MPLLKQAVGQYERKEQQNDQRFQNLISKPFDLNNTQHVKFLEDALDRCEFICNLARIVLGLEELHNTWKVQISILTGAWFMPIPEFIKYVFCYMPMWISLTLGTVGHVFSEYSVSKSSKELDQMKQLYKWIVIPEKKCNEKILENPLVQRLIRLLAPVCDREFLCVWTPVTVSNDQKGFFDTLMQGVRIIVPNSKSDKTADETRLLKEKVEERKLEDTSVMGKAIEYFSSNPPYPRKIIEQKVVPSFFKNSSSGIQNGLGNTVRNSAPHVLNTMRG